MSHHRRSNHQSLGQGWNLHIHPHIPMYRPCSHWHWQLSMKSICIIANCHGFTRLQSQIIFSIRRVCQINCNALHRIANSHTLEGLSLYVSNIYLYIYIYIEGERDSHNNKSKVNIFAALHFGALRIVCKFATARRLCVWRRVCIVFGKCLQ